MTNQSLNRAIFDLECRRGELQERELRTWRDLQDASLEHGEAALLQIELTKIEDELADVRREIANLDDEDRRFFK
jgi:hypothetical protein